MKMTELPVQGISMYVNINDKHTNETSDYNNKMKCMVFKLTIASYRTLTNRTLSEQSELYSVNFF